MLYGDDDEVGRARPDAQLGAGLTDAWLAGFCHGREAAAERMRTAAERLRLLPPMLPARPVARLLTGMVMASMISYHP